MNEETNEETAEVEETSPELEVQDHVDSDSQELPGEAPLAIISEPEPELAQPVTPEGVED